MKKLFAIVLLLVSLSACTRTSKHENAGKLKVLSQNDYKKWYVKESKASLKWEQKIGSLTYTLTYIPKEVMIMHDAGESASKVKIKEVERDYDSLFYFVLKIESDNQNAELLKLNLESPAQYEQRVEYCSFKIQDDIKLQLKGDNYLPCSVCLFERAYDIAPYIKFMVAFDRRTIEQLNNSEITIDLQDKLFNNGPVKFTMEKQLLTEIPTI